MFRSREDVERGKVTVDIEVRCRFRIIVCADSPLRATAASIGAKTLDGNRLDVQPIRGESLISMTDVALTRAGGPRLLQRRSAAW